MIKTPRVAALGTLLLAFAIAVTWAIATRGSRRVPMTREVAREMRAGAEFAASLEIRPLPGALLSHTRTLGTTTPDLVAGQRGNHGEAAYLLGDVVG